MNIVIMGFVSLLMLYSLFVLYFFIDEPEKNK